MGAHMGRVSVLEGAAGAHGEHYLMSAGDDGELRQRAPERLPGRLTVYTCCAWWFAGFVRLWDVRRAAHGGGAGAMVAEVAMCEDRGAALPVHAAALSGAAPVPRAVVACGGHLRLLQLGSEPVVSTSVGGGAPYHSVALDASGGTAVVASGTGIEALLLGG